MRAQKKLLLDAQLFRYGYLSACLVDELSKKEINYPHLNHGLELINNLIDYETLYAKTIYL